MATQEKTPLDRLVESLPPEPRHRVESQRTGTPAKKRSSRRFLRRKLTVKRRKASAPEVKFESGSDSPAPADNEDQKSEEEAAPSNEMTTPPKRSNRRTPPQLPIFDDSDDEDYEDEPGRRKRSKQFVYDSEGAINDILSVSASSDSDMADAAPAQKLIKRKRKDTTK
jgi:hypothetical protein